jgi:hypothetical protein
MKGNADNIEVGLHVTVVRVRMKGNADNIEVGLKSSIFTILTIQHDHLGSLQLRGHDPECFNYAQPCC